MDIRIFISAGRRINLVLAKYDISGFENYIKWFKELNEFVSDKISSNLYSISEKDLDKVKNTNPTFKKESKVVDGRIIIRDNFDALFKKYDNLIMFGEDVGKIGDVNQGWRVCKKIWKNIEFQTQGLESQQLLDRE